jgi:ribosomal protein L32E
MTARATRDREVAIPRDLADVGPVQRCWVIANSMPGASRSEVLAACKELGINRNTAATQYQLWHYARTQARKARALPDKVKRQIQSKAEVEVRA